MKTPDWSFLKEASPFALSDVFLVFTAQDMGAWKFFAKTPYQVEVVALLFIAIERFLLEQGVPKSKVKKGLEIAADRYQGWMESSGWIFNPEIPFKPNYVCLGPSRLIDKIDQYSSLLRQSSN